MIARLIVYMLVRSRARARFVSIAPLYVKLTCADALELKIEVKVTTPVWPFNIYFKK